MSVAGIEDSARLYGFGAVIRRNVKIVHADRNTPGFMRSPPEVPYIFALESAMDELAVALDDGPGRAAPHQRHARCDPINGSAYTSRSLMKCFDEAAARLRLGASATPSPARCATATG